MGTGERRELPMQSVDSGREVAVEDENCSGRR